MECFFQPNLTNEGFKERQGDAPNLHWVDQGNRFLWKKQNQNTKSSPKFGRATYTIEIVTIK